MAFNLKENLKSKKKKLVSIVFWVILVTSFIFFASLIHLKANGWQLNVRTWQLVRTGMILLNGSPDRAEVSLNGKLRSSSFPAKLDNLAPGYYDITVSYPSYQSWQKTIQVEPGKASLDQNIILFLENPQDTEVSSDIKAEIIQNLSKSNENLKVTGSEIFWRDKMVTRFSDNVLMATLYSDNNHLVFQIGNEIRVIDLDGSNNRLLIQLSSLEPTTVMFKNNGRTIYYLDNGKVYGKTIR